MKRKRHTPEQIIRTLRTAEQLLNEGQALPLLLCPGVVVSDSSAGCLGGMKVTEVQCF